MASFKDFSANNFANGPYLLIEYENNNDFSDINDDEILKIKKEMYEEIKSYGINLEEFKDIKKAYELIKEKYNL